MVRIDRIYTRSGDTGETSLGDGTRVAKTSLRIAATGSVDELNCQIGMADSSYNEIDDIAIVLLKVQQRLFDLGADLSCPLQDADAHDERLRISQDQVAWLEETIDRLAKPLKPLRSFVLPGGSTAAAALHVARAVCRRAERDVLCLKEDQPGSVNPLVAVFLNRLSDLLFVLARCANDDGENDVLWVPGKG